MSTDTDNPATADHRREVLKEHRDVFETIRDSDDISRAFRYRYGQRPLEVLDELQEGDADA